MSVCWKFQITARHLLENLSAQLYAEPGDSLMELVRNGVVACMNGSWQPQKATVEISLGRHLLAPKSRALTILDRGSGFTDPCIQLYCRIGPGLDDNRSGRGMHGAAQKRIGRFSAFSLNKACLDGDVHSGFYILTRTAKNGPVKFVPMIPADIEVEQGVTPRMIGPESSELGSLRNIVGPFSAIVIPDPVFSSVEEIRQALAWRIPRKQNLMFNLLVEGKKLLPPPLPTRVTSGQDVGGVEVFIDKIDDEDDKNGGVWIADVATGFRVAYASQLGPQYLPYPLWRRDLVGDIFVPDVLANQDTGRSKLNPRFMKGKVWQNAVRFLISQVVPKARALLGNDDSFSDNRTRRDLLDFVEMCNEVYGMPKNVGDGPEFLSDLQQEQKGKGDKDPTKSSPRDKVGHGGSGQPRGQRPRTLPFQIGGRVFLLSKRSLDPRILAQVDPNGRVIHFNESGYDPLPKARDARVEHVVLKVLEAIGQYDFPGDPHQVQLFVAERRSELLQQKKSR